MTPKIFHIVIRLLKFHMSASQLSPHQTLKIIMQT